MWRRRVSGGRSGLITKAALDYVRLGWSVIPIEPRGNVALVDWPIHRHRRAEPPEIGDWLQRWPEANLAVVTGVVSGLVVLDLDPSRGAEASLAAWRGRHGPLPETVEARTGASGSHLYFAHPGPITPNQAAIAPGIDLYGDGGYLVVPPSVHPSGEPYRWERSPEVFRLMPLPAWLGDLAPTEQRGEQAPLPHWQRLLLADTVESERAATLAALAEHLCGRGVARGLIRELVICWNVTRCRPPLDREEVLRAIEPILRRRWSDLPEDGRSEKEHESANERK